jgi:glycosyltransferase involved in cell wall biosynthesis
MQDTPGTAPAKTIVFVIGSLNRGGAESQLTMLACQLRKRGWTVYVYVLMREGPLLDALEQHQITVFGGLYQPEKQRSKLAKIAQLLKAEWDLIKVIRTRKPDVVHAFLPLTNFTGSIAGRIAGAPLVLTSRRGLGTHQDRHPWLRWMDHLSNRLSHIVTANTSAIAEDVERRDGYPAASIAVIPNGLDFSRFSPDPHIRQEMRASLGLKPDDIAIVKVANIIPYKGHFELIPAFAELAKTDQRLKLFLAGEDRGPASELKQLAASCCVLDRIAFLGGCPDVAPLLKAMDLGVMASHEEGLSNALIEKLAAGLPVVATQAGGNPDVLAGMPDCRLVRARDEKDLASGLKAIIENLELSTANRSARIEILKQRYSIEAMVDAYENLYAGKFQ